MNKEVLIQDRFLEEYTKTVSELHMTYSLMGRGVAFSRNPLTRYLASIARQGFLTPEQHTYLRACSIEERREYFKSQKAEAEKKMVENAKELLTHKKVTAMPGLIASGAFSKNTPSSLSALRKAVKNEEHAEDWELILNKTHRLIEERGFLVLPSPEYQKPITVTFDEYSMPIIEAQEKGAFEWVEEVYGKREKGKLTEIKTPFQVVGSMFLFGSFKRIRASQTEK